MYGICLIVQFRQVMSHLVTVHITADYPVHPDCRFPFFLIYYTFVSCHFSRLLIDCDSEINTLNDSLQITLQG